jgi:gliding motility-associated-like protein
MKSLDFFLVVFLILWTSKSVGQEIHVHDDKFKFIENKGQWPDFVFFRAENRQSKIYLEQGRILYHFMDLSEMHKVHGKDSKGEPKVRQELIAAKFIGAQQITQVISTKVSNEYYNYFIGNDKNKWASHVRAFADVRLNGVYPGIDLHYNNQGDFLKYDFIVAPGADPKQIQIEYQNAKSITITKKGGIRIAGEIGLIEEAKPFAYQIINGKIVQVPCKFKIEKTVVSYELGNYDKALELVIDPEIIFASYSGSLSDNFGMTATYDYDGNLFSGGIVFGNSYPTTAGAYDTNGNFSQVNAAANQGLLYGITDIFISKYSADGTTMLYSTYIGGGNDIGGVDVVHSLICNEQNELYFFGTTSSSNFPLVSPVQSTFNGGVYREFTSNGTHFWGNNQSQVNGGTDLIIVKMSANGSNLLASTYYGGSHNDGLNYNENGIVNGNQFGGLMYNYGDPFRGEIMLDDIGNVYVASCTYSSNFPLVNATQSVYGGNQDGVLIKFNPQLTTVLWSTYWGGNARDACYAIKFDSAGNIYAAGGTQSGNFATTPGAFQTVHGGVSQADGFISKFSPAFALLNSTFIGTSQYDQSFFIQIDRDDFLYVLGQSRGGITATPGKYANANSGQYIMKFTNNLSTQVWRTVFGNGNGLVNISPTAFLVDVCGNIYVSGWGGGIAGSLQQGSAVTGMPITPDAFQPGSGNGYNFYLIVLSPEAEELLYATYLGGGQSQEHVDGGTSRFDSRGVVYHSACGGCGANSDFPTFPSNVWSPTNNSANCNNLVFKFDFKIVPQSNFTSTSIEGCAPFVVDFVHLGSDTTNFIWDFGDGVIIDNIVNPSHTYTTPGVYEAMLIVLDTECQLADTAAITITVFEELSVGLPSDIVACNADEVLITADTQGTAQTYLWSSNSNFTDTLNVYPDDPNLLVNITNPGTYYIQVTNDFCEKVDSITVTFIDETLELIDSTTICLGQETPITVVNTNPNVTFSYSWTPSSAIVSGANAATVIASPGTSQYLYLYAVASNGCEITDSVFVNVITIDPSLLSASAVPDTVPPGGATVALIGNAPDGYTTTWLPSSSVANPDALETSAFVNQNTTFYFVATDGYCIDTVPIIVRTYEVFCIEPFVFIPNAFSPNGDGNNDILFVRGNYIENMIFRIYNRWGEMVFESKDKNIGWDGVFKGKLCEPDVYDYYLDVECVGGFNNLITGNVTIVR